MSKYVKDFSEKQIIQPLVDRDIKDELIKSFKKGNVVLFIGAGLSANLMLPDWKQFAYDYLDFLYYECKNDDGEKIINYKTYNQLRNEDFKMILSLCRNLHKSIGQCDLNRKINEWFCIDIDEKDLEGISEDKKIQIIKSKKEAFEKVKKLDSIFRKVYELNEIFITTNYDDILDILVEEKNKEHSNEVDKIDSYKNKFFYKEEDFQVNEVNLQKGNVFHIHGSINESDDLIISVEDYIERYWGKDNQYKKFLTYIFSNYDVIFIGYGLQEIEILQYMFKGFSISMNKRYMIVDCYADEYLKVNILNKYYKDNYGVTLIPYDKTENGYRELEEIVDGLTVIKNQAITKKQAYEENLKFIENLNIERVNKEKEVDFLLKLKETPELYATFFYKINGNFLWYDLVKKSGYFYKDEIVKNDAMEVSLYPFKYLSSIINCINKNTKEVNDVLELCKEVIKINNIHIDYEVINIIFKLKDFYDEDFLNEFLKLLNSNAEIIQSMLVKLEILFDEFIAKNDDKSICILKFIINKYLENGILNKSFLGQLLHDIKLYECNSKIICKIIDIFIKITICTCKYESYFEINNEKYKVRLDNRNSIIIISNLNDINVEKKIYKDRFDIYNIMKKFIEDKNLEVDSDEYAKRICEDFFTSSESYHSIFKENGYYMDDLEYCTAIIKELLCKLRNKDDITKYIKLLLDNDLSILNKLALFLLVQRFDYLTFMDLEFVIYNKKFEYILRHYIFDDEIKRLFKCLKTNDDGMEKRLDSIIDKGPYIFNSLYRERNYLEIWKQKRYKALNQFDFFNKKYELLHEKTNVDYDLVAPVRIGQIGFVKELSYIDFDECKSMPVNMLIEKLNNLDITKFKTNEPFQKYSYKGTGNTLKNIIINNPLKYLSEINKFKEIKNYIYNVYIIQAIEELLKQNKGISEYYESILNFSINIYSVYDFENLEKEKAKEVNEKQFYKTVFSTIIFMLNNDFIKETMAEDIKKFIKKISEQVLNIPVDKILWSNDDFIFYIINSVQGHYLNIILSFNLFLKRNKLIEFGTVWNEEKTIIELFLKNNEIDSNIFLGWNIINFQYIESDWIENIIKQLQVGSNSWQYFVGGYSYSNYFTKKNYKLMYENIKEALTFKFKDKNIKQKISERVSLGFLIGYEEKFNKVLYKKFIEHIGYENVLSFTKIATQVKSMDIFENISYQDIERRALEFWNDVINKINYDYNDNENRKKIVEQTLYLLKVFENFIDEGIVKIIIAVTEICEFKYNQYLVVRYILDILETPYVNKINTDHIVNLLSKLIITYWNEDMEKVFELVKDKIEPKEFLKLKADFINNNMSLGPDLI